jgi:hypothetical protein
MNAYLPTRQELAKGVIVTLVASIAIAAILHASPQLRGFIRSNWS